MNVGLVRYRDVVHAVESAGVKVESLCFDGVDWLLEFESNEVTDALENLGVEFIRFGQADARGRLK